MTNEFFLHRVSDTEAARVPFPLDVALEDREAYMANVPAEAVAAAARIPFDWTVSDEPAQPAEKPAAPSLEKTITMPSFDVSADDSAAEEEDE